MADARALLRQQREARRIQHPHATYTDAGKLLCSLCRDSIKSDSLWDTHLKSATHKKRLQALKESREAAAESTDAAPTQKRKLDDDDSDAMDTSEEGSRKRTKADTETTPPVEDNANGKDVIRTPPTLARRTSATPSQGVEIQIPSRPATPAHRDSSSSSTPGGSALGSAVAGTFPRQPSSLGPGVLAAVAAAETRPSSTAAQVDESEWAAFEADIAASAVPYDEDATISAPAMNAEEAAAASAAAIADESDVKRKTQADIDIEDEREEATRAMEDEFEDMQELEARVQKLKNQREALRNRTGSQSLQNGDAVDQIKKTLQLEKSKLEEPVKEDDEEEEDESDEDDDDEWDGFRFRK